jgi:hypothetical protein
MTTHASKFLGRSSAKTTPIFAFALPAITPPFKPSANPENNAKQRDGAACKPDEPS